jgi:hypothetical protein
VVSDKPTPTGPADVIAGAVVRELVDRNEREIGALQHELDAALREAETAEQQVADHPAAGERTPRSVPDGWPRTTVVTRTYGGGTGESGAAGRQ